MSKRGKLIVVEASNDRLGKTTVTNKLIKKLEEQGIKTKFIHYPDETSITGQYIINLLNPHTPIDIKDLDPIHVSNTYILDMASSKAKVQEYLEQGYWVILDRYYYSTVLYESTLFSLESVQNSLPSAVVDKALEIRDLAKNKVYNLPEPDFTICLYADDIIMDFYNSVKVEADNLEGLDFQRQLLQTFKYIREYTSIFDNFHFYDRGKDGRIVESDLIVEDFMKVLFK